MSILISGSVAVDHVKTPHDEKHNLLGGSASYAALAAGFFTEAHIVSIVGEDFPQEHWDLLEAKNIGIGGIHRSSGLTFRWSGEYFHDWNHRETRDVALNVLEHYEPEIDPLLAGKNPILLLANSGPDTQLKVMQQCTQPRYRIADTMDLWITIARERLIEVIAQVDLVILNDSEARLLTEESNLMRAAQKILDYGPPALVIKKGEHGALLFGQDNFFSCGAYPLENIHDPTGAGDAFVGGLAGYLDKNATGEKVTFDDLRQAVVHGTIVASFTCEAFGVGRVASLTETDLLTRYEEFRQYTSY